MTSWWRFPPQTREGQFDEKWAFVGKKEKHCDPADPADAFQGDNWDHVAYDPEHRLVLAVVPGKRSAENVKKVVQEFQRRTDDETIELLTSDEYKPYKSAIHQAYGEEVIPPPTGKPGRPKNPYLLPPTDLNYATVHKTRKQGRVIDVDFRTVFGTEDRVRQALARSAVSSQVNTAFIERHNGTDRHRNARKTRKSYCFSKDWQIHEAVTYFTMYSYNFCWPVRTLREKDDHGRYHHRTPAMAAGLADHVWSLREWLTFPAMQWN
jgi:IS1 family transposase